MVRPCQALVLVLFVAACGNRPEPAATPSLTDPAKASVDPTTPGSPSSAAPAASVDPNVGEPAHHTRKPFSIHSSCPDIATIAFGEDPKAAGVGKRTVASNSAIDGPRDADGKQTVWLLDAKGEPLVKVHITRGMKQLEIGRSCRTLDAH
jgi:hypothetical protein